MFSIPAEYHRLLIVPATQRFEKEPTAFDLCFSACVYIAHFADVYAHHNDKSLTAARKELNEANPSFNVIYAVATAAKHVVVSNAQFGELVGLMAEQAQVASGAAFSDGSYYSDGTSHSDAPNVVRIQTPDGKWHDLLHEVRSVVETINAKFLLG